MGLGDRNLASGFMKTTYGAQSTPDEMEYRKLRNADGGRLSTASFYESTGSMPVAKTLARHYRNGGAWPPGQYSTEENPILYTEEDKKKAAAAKVAAATPKGDPWEYNMEGDNVLTRKIGDPNWITTSGDIRQKILDQEFPDYASPVAPEAEVAADPNEVTVDFTDLDESIANFDPDDPFVAETTTEGTDPAVEPNWWKENQTGIGRFASNAASAALNVAPHLSNIKRYKEMPGVRAPNLQKTVTTKAPSLESTRQAIIAQGRNQANATGTSPQGNVAQRAAAMAGTQSALSQLGGQEQRMQSQVDARNAQMSNQANARNVYAMNRSLEQQTSRDLAQTRGIANEWGNIASKSLGFIGDVNRQKLDRERMALTERRYDQFGVMQRNAYEYYQANGKWPDWYSGSKALPE